MKHSSNALKQTFANQVLNVRFLWEFLANRLNSLLILNATLILHSFWTRHLLKLLLMILRSL